MAGNNAPLVTTDYILDELFTLLRFRGEFATALKIAPFLLAQRHAKLELVTLGDIQDAWRVFATFGDKQWSFTDCVSRVAMQRMGITEAFAFDVHFRQFGTVNVVP
jgi:uncharacterized protein